MSSCPGARGPRTHFVAAQGVRGALHPRSVSALAHVERLEPTPSGAYVASLRGGHRVPISRAAASRLRKTLGI